LAVLAGHTHALGRRREDVGNSTGEVTQRHLGGELTYSAYSRVYA
jgi:hypothetical protein